MKFDHKKSQLHEISEKVTSMQNNIVQDHIFNPNHIQPLIIYIVDHKNQDDWIYVVYSCTLSGFVMFCIWVHHCFSYLYMKYLEAPIPFGFLHAKQLL